ncbi:uncharacterized protein LOC132576086 isoform X1 [Heteronotia binoei]|uniref:uncharacterized protein LOC132576086 isoform X1 n=1 Tax=Heteronotia binoei TaxID=13085 RepID=UPI00292DBAC1|nr:uncharacterized protein LOC132576086 isoform X1 [Heteronotia binoei]
MNEVACAQTRAQTFLLMALSCERAIHWHEAIEYYRQLLKVLSKDKLPEEYVPGPLYTQLLFETCYHLGIAFQKLDSHRNAVEEFTNAIEFAQVPKYACQVGCVSRSFFHTPVFARRAYAYVKCDKIKEAIKDANKTVELDPSNPDVYCIRALVWGSTKEKRRALVDLNNSLKLNSSHICSLILRGAILNSLTGVTSPMHNKDHRKAFSLCPDSQKFFDVQDFNSPKMSSFYDSCWNGLGSAIVLAEVVLERAGATPNGRICSRLRLAPRNHHCCGKFPRYLWSLNAFHTVTEVNLFSGAAFHPKLPYSPYRSRKLPGVDGNQSRMKEPFRCGSVTVYPDETSLLRRKIYSKSLRSDLD